MPRPALVANFVLFQLGWVVSVVGAARGYPAAGMVYAVVWSTMHHWYISNGRFHELLLVLAGAALGFVVDSLLVLGGVIAFPVHASLGSPSTVWMVSLWVMFAMTLRHSLGWLRGRYLSAVLLGAVFGPLAYWAGSRIGAIHLGDHALPAIALVWALSMVGLLVLERLTRAAMPEAAVRGAL